MDRFSALWARLAPAERTMISIGVPVVVVAALWAGHQKKKAAAAKPATPAATGTPQIFLPPSGTWDTPQTTPTPSTSSPTTPTPATSTPNPAGMTNLDLILGADAAYSAGTGYEPFIVEMEHRAVANTLSVNDPTWRDGDGKPRGIVYAAFPRILKAATVANGGKSIFG